MVQPLMLDSLSEGLSISLYREVLASTVGAHDSLERIPSIAVLAYLSSLMLLEDLEPNIEELFIYPYIFLLDL